MSGITPSSKNAAEAFQKTVQAVDQLVEVPRKIREAYREFRLDGVINKINERLYGRYQLIHALQNFGLMQGPEDDFDEIIKTARDRAEYLRNFNKKIEPRIKKVSPQLAANLIALTNETIKFYELLGEIEDVERMGQMAPALAEELKKIADYLERVNKKLRELIPES